MMLKPTMPQGVPVETARVARQIYGKGNIYMALHDELGRVFADEDFAAVYSHTGKPALAAWRQGLVSVMQYVEGLSDEQAAEAVRSRIDWKYLLELELTDSGFEASVLCKFRQRVLAGGIEAIFLEAVLQVLRQAGHVKARGKQRTDSTHILAAVRDLNRLECVGETLRQALNVVAILEPGWLNSWMPADWIDRYGTRIAASRLPKKTGERQALAEQIGADGQQLLSQLATAEQAMLHDCPATTLLRQVWQQQYKLTEGEVQWRPATELPPCEALIQTPYDDEARYATKRQQNWTGYKVHFTETCDDDGPHLIVNVLTTAATTPDVAVTQTIHTMLADQQRLPAEHWLDSGYLDADHLVNIPAQFAVELIGRVAEAPPRQLEAHPQFDHRQFQIDWQQQAVTCPAGHTSTVWSETTNTRRNGRQQTVIKVRFARTTCQTCPLRSRCTSSQKNGRSLELLPQQQYEALAQARATQQTAAFKHRYQRRAGIEGTVSHAVNVLDMRQSRYVGQARTHLHNLLTGAAINLKRWYAWRCGVPLVRSRASPLRGLVA